MPVVKEFLYGEDVKVYVENLENEESTSTRDLSQQTYRKGDMCLSMRKILIHMYTQIKIGHRGVAQTKRSHPKML